MKNLFLTFIILPGLLTINSCKKDDNLATPVIDNRQTFDLGIYEYSRNHYFVHEVYADTSANLNMFSNYYAYSIPQANSFYIIKRLEVWKSIRTPIPDSIERFVNAFINLPSKRYGEPYDISFKYFRGDPTPGKEEIGRFVLLKGEIDYSINKYTGMLSFNTDIQDPDVIAVSFTIDGPTNSPDDDIQYGEYIEEIPDTNITDPLVLKLIRPMHLIPQYSTAWRLQLKNIYPIKVKNIDDEGFELNIEALQNEKKVTTIQTLNGYISLLSLFGLDKYDVRGGPSADGSFDFRPGITIDPEKGVIIFPYLQPFGRQLNPAIPDSMRLNALYDTTRTAVKHMMKPIYRISGKYNIVTP